MRSLRAAVHFLVKALLGGSVGLAGAGVMSAWAEDCPGNPDALGTSRVLVLEPGTLTRVGIMQYPQSLPLADKEVVLTFDDGPIPHYSNAILDILAAQCVQATYFLVGSMARAFPATVRRIYEAGHTVGTHSEDHPSRFGKLPIEKMRQEIDEGIADVAAALGDPKELAPFFRIPGLARSDAVEAELAARSLVVFSSDTVADDWHRRIRPSDIVRRAMSRLEARGKGILLLHDIHQATVVALPELLKQLKAAGFHIVHVVPAPADRIEMAGRDVHWPEPSLPETMTGGTLLAPDAKSFATDYRPWRVVVLADGSTSAGYLALAAIPYWLEPAVGLTQTGEPELPVPDITDITDLSVWLFGTEKAAASGAAAPIVIDTNTSDGAGAGPGKSPIPDEPAAEMIAPDQMDLMPDVPPELDR
jgi:peptidoglycan/xylan/chitin deacetylase (PgdA/CDA1 family)